VICTLENPRRFPLKWQRPYHELATLKFASLRRSEDEYEVIAAVNFDQSNVPQGKIKGHIQGGMETSPHTKCGKTSEAQLKAPQLSTVTQALHS
jgi:hypothetical protein